MHTNLTGSGFYHPLGGSKHVFEVRNEKKNHRKTIESFVLSLVFMSKCYAFNSIKHESGEVSAIIH